MFSGAEVTRGRWVAYGVLVFTAVWLGLMATGATRSWAHQISRQLPPWLILTAVLATPLLGAMCSLNVSLDLRIRIAAFVILVAAATVLPLAFDAHPLLVTLVGLGTFLEAYAIIPAINRRWLSRRT